MDILELWSIFPIWQLLVWDFMGHYFSAVKQSHIELLHSKISTNRYCSMTHYLVQNIVK